MDALAATATVVQLSLYAYNVVQALQELRQIIRKGDAKLQEQSKRLEVLEFVVRKIEQDTRLHSQLVAGYLVLIRDHILRLHGFILHKLGHQQDTFLRRLSAGLSLLRANKQIKDAFASLGQDCNYLTLYMSKYNSSPSATHTMAPQYNSSRSSTHTLAPDQQHQVSNFVGQGRALTENPPESGVVVPSQPIMQRGNPGTSPSSSTSPNSSGAQGRESVDAAPTAPGNIDQAFKDISSSGEGNSGQASSNECGNVKAAALKGGNLKQEYSAINADLGGQNRMGNIG